MSEYSSGLTFGKACNMYKEAIKHALKYEEYAGSDEYGNPVLIPIDSQEARDIILRAYDETVYQALQALASCRAMETLYKRKTGSDFDFREYMEEMGRETQRFHDYVYEKHE